MGYVEFLRVRTGLLWYSGIIIVVVGTVLLSLHNAHVSTGSGVGVTVDSGSSGRVEVPKHLAIPFGVLLGIAGYCGVVFATVVAASLNRQNQNAEFVWTRPVSRERLALTFMLIDLAGIVAAFLIALVVIDLTPLASVGLLHHVFLDPHALAIGVLALGVGVMWYGLLQAVTAGYRGRGQTIVGISWGVFFLLIGASQIDEFGPLFHAIVRLVNLLNPLAYLTSLSVSHAGTTTTSLLPLDVALRALIVWAIGLAGCAIAIFSWKRVEV